MPQCEAMNPYDQQMQCAREATHAGPHMLGGIMWTDEDVPTRRVSLDLSHGGRMDVSLPGKTGDPIPERTLAALRAVGEAALNRLAGNCENGCAVDAENPLHDDGFCQGCHDYPEGS